MSLNAYVRSAPKRSQYVQRGTPTSGSRFELSIVCGVARGLKPISSIRWALHNLLTQGSSGLQAPRSNRVGSISDCGIL